jgi:riboflavin kinase/FMN adenylyltransferase
MKVIYKKLPSRRKKCIATIGVFDGIHQGHQFILKKVREEAEKLGLSSLVITFDVLPQQFLHKDFLAGRRSSRKIFSGYLTDLEQKKSLIKLLGLDYLWFLRTSHYLLELSPRKFIEHIFKYFAIEKLIVGEDFHFGHEGRGSVDYLKKIKGEYKFKLLIAKKKIKDKKVISSSVIRHFIKEGDLAQAKKFLGRNYSIRGVVHRGKRLGTKLEFPTANIYTHDYVVPHSGVYAAYVILGKEIHLAAVNIGLRPTVEKTTKTILEAHIINFRKDILGKTIEVIFLEKVRGEHKFSSLAKLKTAIRKDIDLITSKYSIYPPKIPQLVVG